MGKKVFITDCEGPISLNDNAFELAGHFIEDGEKFFEIISGYDDILADEVKRQGYNAGSTLKLILPFLKAYGANNINIKKFSEKNILLVPGARDALQFVFGIMPSFIISTSYEQYIQVLCDLTGFPYKNTYSTQLDISKFPLTALERFQLIELRKKIINHPEFENIDQIFTETIPHMKIGRMIKEVKTIGGEGKKDAVEDIIERSKFKASDLIYIGDSITDVQPLQFIRDKGGLSVSFNGNEYAIREAEVAVISDNAIIISILADLFNRFGKEKVIEFIEMFVKNPESALKQSQIHPYLIKKIQNTNLPLIEIIRSDNIERLIEESTEFRKKVRGEAIGSLG